MGIMQVLWLDFVVKVKVGGKAKVGGKVKLVALFGVRCSLEFVVVWGSLLFGDPCSLGILVVWGSLFFVVHFTFFL